MVWEGQKEDAYPTQIQRMIISGQRYFHLYSIFYLSVMNDCGFLHPKTPNEKPRTYSEKLPSHLCNTSSEVRKPPAQLLALWAGIG